MPPDTNFWCFTLGVRMIGQIKSYISELLFGSKEVQNTLAKLKELQPQFKSDLVWNTVATDEIFASAKTSVIKSKSTITNTIRNNNQSVNETALTSLYNAAYMKLASGDGSLGYGIVSDKGRGYKFVFDKIIDLFLEYNLMTKEEADSAHKDLQNILKCM